MSRRSRSSDQHMVKMTAYGLLSIVGNETIANPAQPEIRWQNIEHSHRI